MTNLDIAWESVENEGPGIYNEAYLANFRKLLLIAEKDGISVSINFFQSAPAWAKNSQIEKDTLYGHYKAAFDHTQRRLKNCKAVTCFRLNEP